MAVDPEQRITWSRNLFPKDSFGQSVVPEVLEGKSRPKGTLDASLALWSNWKVIPVLLDKGITDIKTLLEQGPKDIETVLGVRGAKRLGKFVDQYLFKQAVGGEGYLVAWYLNDEPTRPLPNDLDEQRNKLVAGYVGDLKNPNHQTVLDLAYGLTDGMCRSNAEIAKTLSVNNSRAGQIHAAAIGTLKQLGFDEVLYYATFPENSLAQEVLDMEHEFDFLRAFKEKKPKLEDLGLPVYLTRNIRDPRYWYEKNGSTAFMLALRSQTGRQIELSPEDKLLISQRIVKVLAST